MIPVPAPGGVREMRLVATGLLVAMAALYLTAKYFESLHPAVGFIKAFAEAAMVGGLADWFAVSALFRHPLGLPIPHTAIIPRNKDRIGDTLASFLRDNFLIPAVVARRMRRLDVAAAAGRMLSEPSGQDEDGRLRRGAGRMLATLVDALDDERFGGMAKNALVQRVKSLDLAPMLGQALQAAMRDGRHAVVLDGLIRWAARTLNANSVMIHAMVHERANTLMRWTGLDEKLASGIIDGLDRMLQEAAEDPAHRLRIKAEEGLARLAEDLQHDPVMQARVAHVRDEMIANPAMQRWLDGLWQQLRAALGRAARDPEAALAGKLGEAVREFGGTLQGDESLRRLVNRFARRLAVGTAARYGGNIVKLVSETVRGWDARTVTERLEQAVGRDLQFIRINGTLVGGLIGVGLHAIDVLL